MSFSLTLHLIPLRQGLSGNTKFSLSVGELGWPASSCLCLLTLGLQAHVAVSSFFAGAGVFNSGSHSCITSVLTHGSPSQPLHFPS